jgi:predicted secreted protein
MKTFAISALLVALAAPGCISSSDDDLVFEAGDGKADSTRPFGRFERPLQQGDAGFTMLQLNEDKTYEASQELVRCEPGNCTDAFSGTFRWASSNGKKYVVLYNEGDWWYSFEYKLNGDELALRDKGGTEWFTMMRARDGLELDAGDNGGHFEVSEGDDVVLRLAANPTTGYDWKVTSTDRTFGYPTTTFTRDSSGAIGSGGMDTFTWKTSGVLSQVGTHNVKMEYRRSWDTTSPAANFYEFTVDVVAAP